MNKNKVIGLVLVVVAAALACFIASSGSGSSGGLVGKAVWYLPYLAFVGGIRKLDRNVARGKGGRWRK